MLPDHPNEIGEVLRDMGVISSVDITRILLEQKRTHQQFGQIAVFWGLANEEQVCEAWARQLASDQRHVDLDQFGVDSMAVKNLTVEQARQFRAVPVRSWGSHLVVAMVTMSLDGKVFEEIAQASGIQHIHACYCRPDQLDRYLEKYYPQPSTDQPSATPT